LGLNWAGDQSPSPADRLASPFVGLASPFARLAEKRACMYYSPLMHYPIGLNDPTMSIKCLLPGLVLFSTVLITGVLLCGRRQWRPGPILSIQHKHMGLLHLTDSSINVTYPVDTDYAKTTVYLDLTPIFGVPKRRKFKQLKNKCFEFVEGTEFAC
jgi:hypothetical protein